MSGHFAKVRVMTLVRQDVAEVGRALMSNMVAVCLVCMHNSNSKLRKAIAYCTL